MNWVIGVLAVIAVMPGAGLGTAHAQGCDPGEVDKLLASDGAVYDDFGYSISISSDTAVIGAPENGGGSAYVFTRSGGVWTQQAKLRAADGAEGDFFGTAVSISGDTAIVGAFRDDDNHYSGSAYVFTRSVGVWTQQAKLLSADGAGGDEFGYSVSISGDTAVIGAFRDDDNGLSSGSAYVFSRSRGVWAQQAKLLASDGAPDDWFGHEVSSDGETVVIASPLDDDRGSNSGSAFVFTRSGGAWTQQAKLLPTVGAARNGFGASISVNGDTAVIGAKRDDDQGSDSGSAYVFTRTGGVWTQQAKLLASDGAADDWFGCSVSIGGDTAVIGAIWDDDGGVNSGSAYVFRRSGSVWTQQAKFLPADGEERDIFGNSISISGDTVVVGARGNDDYGDSSGSAYVFELGCNDCPADFNGDGTVNTQDFISFLNAWAIGDSLADWNEDGEVNTLDFQAYLTDWSAGCP